MKQETAAKTRKREASSSQSKLPRIRASEMVPTVTSKEDILIAIKPDNMNHIVKRTKNHEFRKYFISNTVQRMWLYVSSPDQTLRYIATIGHGKVPGDIAKEDGIGNADFNAGLDTAAASYAYEIKELYQLKEPLARLEMQARYGAAFPQRFIYVPEKMVEAIALEDQIRVF